MRLEGLVSDSNEEAEGEEGLEGANSEQGLVGLGWLCGARSWTGGCCGGPVMRIDHPV